MRKRRKPKDLEAVADSVYRESDSDKYLRLVNSLSSEERAEVLRKVGARIDADKARFSKPLEGIGAKNDGR